MRWAGLAALAAVLFGLATLVVLYVAATTEAGPILLELSATHGVHAGDVIAGLVAYGSAGALVLIVAEATAPRGRPRSSPPPHPGAPPPPAPGPWSGR